MTFQIHKCRNGGCKRIFTTQKKKKQCINCENSKKKYRMNPKNWKQLRMNAMVHHAKQRDVQYKRFDARNHITIKDLKEKLTSQKGCCIYCNCPLLTKCTPRHKQMFSVERKDNTIGHSKNNCVISCYKCNMCRPNSMSFDTYLMHRSGKSPTHFHRSHATEPISCDVKRPKAKSL